jgi:hypothetical protein
MGPPPLDDQIMCGLGPRWIFELKAGFEQAARNDLTALEDQFRFSTQEKSAQLQHPPCGRQTDARAPRFSKNAKEFAVREWVGGGQVYCSSKLCPVDEELNRPNKVHLMNP